MYLKKKKIFLHRDNARCTPISVLFLWHVEFKMELLLHLAYPPDLNPSDYLMFPNLKKWLDGRRLTSNEDIIAQTNEYFAELLISNFFGRFGQVC